MVRRIGRVFLAGTLEAVLAVVVLAVVLVLVLGGKCWQDSGKCLKRHLKRHSG